MAVNQMQIEMVFALCAASMWLIMHCQLLSEFHPMIVCVSIQRCIVESTGVSRRILHLMQLRGVQTSVATVTHDIYTIEHH
jgi:hypothetical protein